MQDTSNKVLEKIKQKKITPKPKWQFWLEQVGLWFLAVVSVLIGSNALATIIFRMVNNDWDTIRFLGRDPLSHAFRTLPYLWIIVTALFILLAYYNTRHTKKGYRYGTYGVVIGSILSSVILGITLYSAGLAPHLELFINKQIPGYQKLMPHREEIWAHPEDGFLAGRITKILGGSELFEIEDLNEDDWVIVPNNVMIHPAIEIEEGELIRIIGEIEQKPVFKAKRILPWLIGPGHNINPLPGMPMSGSIPK